MALEQNLENVTGTLLAYKELEPGTFQHVDQITTERRTGFGFGDQLFHTADGELYTVQKKGHLWAITREPQNLVLQNIDEAYRQLTGQGNYFPNAEAAKASLEHKDSVVVDLEGLELVKDYDHDQQGHFAVDPKKTERLNSEQRRAAQRIYGPDEENFGLNMEMFAEARITPYVFVLRPDYVQSMLRSNDKRFLAQSSSLGCFFYSGANSRDVKSHIVLRGIRKIASGDAPKVAGKQPPSERSETTVNEVPSVPQETEGVKSQTMEDILGRCQ